LDVFGRQGIPVRHFVRQARFCGQFYGQTGRGDPLPDAISTDSLSRLLSQLSPGLTELACHPGFDDQHTTSYALERRREVATLCSSEVKETVEAESILLTTFKEVRHLLSSKRLGSDKHK
jgi:predicted glycoside hydrolase/deacetylase ChbG (UPF0249 family)